MQVHGFSETKCGNYSSLLGVGYVISGMLGVKSLKRFGQLGHTRLANWGNILANLAWAAETGDTGSIIGQVRVSEQKIIRDWDLPYDSDDF